MHLAYTNMLSVVLCCYVPGVSCAISYVRSAFNATAARKQHIENSS